jgi:drug/metabolite transporter (DMT)-like permease
MSFNPVYAGIAVSSLSWSFFDLSRKKLAIDLNPVPVVAWLTLFQGLVFLALSFFDSWQMPGGSYWVPFVASVALNAFANIWFVEAVSLAPFSLAIPILSLTPVFSSIGGLIVLHEALSSRQAAGIAVIVAATLLIGYFGTTSSAESEVVDRAAVRKGLFLMAVVALLFALTPVVDKLCLKTISSSEHGTLQCFATWACLIGWIRVRGGGVPFSRIRANLVWFLAAVLFASLAVYFQFWSIQSISVGIFEALKRSCGLITALVLGFVVFKEAFTWSKLVLVCLMGVGIFVLLT